MLLLLGAAFPGALRIYGTPNEHGNALNALAAVDGNPLLAEDWFFEDGRECSAGQRGAAEKECLAAVQKAAHKRGMEATSFRIVDRGLVPPGCSYCFNSKTALFNSNAGSWHRQGNYRLACLATHRPQRVVILSRGRGGSTVLSTTLAAFAHTDAQYLHHGVHAPPAHLSCRHTRLPNSGLRSFCPQSFSARTRKRCAIVTHSHSNLRISG